VTVRVGPGQKVLNSSVILRGPVPAVFRESEWPDVETSSVDYDRRFVGAVGQYMLKVQEQTVLGLLADLPQGASVLEVGGGHAQLAGPIARQGRHVTVLGSSPVCSAKLAGEISAGLVDFLAADFTRLPFADQSFDAVVSIRMMAHVEHWAEFVSELCRVSRRVVVIDYPSLSSLNLLSLATFGMKRAIEKNTRTYRSFWPAEIRGAFRPGGFTKLRSAPQFVLPMVAHRATAGAPILRKVEDLSRKLGVTQHLGNPVLVRADRA